MESPARIDAPTPFRNRAARTSRQRELRPRRTEPARPPGPQGRGYRGARRRFRLRQRAGMIRDDYGRCRAPVECPTRTTPTTIRAEGSASTDDLGRRHPHRRRRSVADGDARRADPAVPRAKAGAYGPNETSGGTSRYCNAKRAICENAGAATTPPQIAPCGSSAATRITSRGLVAGTKPTNDATYRPVE
jgi:hypothetical protein